MKTKRSCVTLQPAESGRASEAFLKGLLVGTADVEGAAGVMFAVPRRSDEAKHSIDVFPAGELLPDDLRLPPNAAKTGERNEGDRIAGCGGSHSVPGCGRRWREPNRLALVVLCDPNPSRCFPLPP